MRSGIFQKILRLSLGLALSVFFLWLAFRHVDAQRLWQTLGRVEVWTVIAFLLGMCVQQIARVLRWAALVRPLVTMSFSQAMRISNLGIMLILILPLRLGEFTRPYLMKKELGVAFSSSLAAAVVERTLDGLLVLLVFFVSLQWLPADAVIPKPLAYGAYVALAVFGSASAVIVSALVAHRPAIAILNVLMSPLPDSLRTNLLGLLENFVAGFGALPSASAMLRVVGYTLVYWGFNGLMYYVVMRGLGFEAPLLAGYLVVSIVVFAIMIPGAPGFLGAFQWALVLGLGIFGISDSDAAAYGLVVYPGSVLVIVAFGLPYFLTIDGGLSALVQDSQSAMEDVVEQSPGDS